MGVPGLCVRMCVHTHPKLCEEQSSDHPEVTDATRMTPVPGWHLIGTHQWERHNSVCPLVLSHFEHGWMVCMCVGQRLIWGVFIYHSLT